MRNACVRRTAAAARSKGMAGLWSCACWATRTVVHLPPTHDTMRDARPECEDHVVLLKSPAQASAAVGPSTPHLRRRPSVQFDDSPRPPRHYTPSVKRGPRRTKRWIAWATLTAVGVVVVLAITRGTATRVRTQLWTTTILASPARLEVSSRARLTRSTMRSGSLSVSPLDNPLCLGRALSFTRIRSSPICFIPSFPRKSPKCLAKLVGALSRHQTGLETANAFDLFRTLSISSLDLRFPTTRTQNSSLHCARRPSVQFAMRKPGRTSCWAATRAAAIPTTHQRRHQGASSPMQTVRVTPLA